MEMTWAYEVDLEAPTVINRIVVSFDPHAFATAFKLVVSADGNTWTTVLDKKDHDGGKVDAKINPITARYVRVIAIKPDGSSPQEKGGQMQVTELEVYGR